MKQVLIAYATDYSATEQLARAVEEGVAAVEGVTTKFGDIDDLSRQDILDSAGVLFGSPVHMGSMHWRAKRFIDRECGPLWNNVDLSDRFCGTFGTGGGFGEAGAGCDLALLSMLSNFAQLGMLIVPLPPLSPHFADGGSQWGPYARTKNSDGTKRPIAEGALRSATAYGRRFACLVSRSGQSFS